MNQEEKFAAVVLASNALDSARVGNWSQAGACVQELHDTYNGLGIQLLLVALADTLLISQGGPPDPNAIVVPMWIDATDGDVGLADDVPPPVRWAGRFIAARAADDEDACAALYNACATDEELTDNVCAMLEVVATTLNITAGTPITGGTDQ